MNLAGNVTFSFIPGSLPDFLSSPCLCSIKNIQLAANRDNFPCLEANCGGMVMI